MANKYTMTISRLTVDKLGVKLYGKVSAVISEIVANSYDADATEVRISAPMGEYLAAKIDGKIKDKGFEIVVEDNGTGMHPHVIDGFYLKVGAERRDDPLRGSMSGKFGRKVMGRKGIGKLAPFGICEKIEVISSGGEAVSGKDENGEERNKYKTAHFILDRVSILQESHEDYHPEVGSLDEELRDSTGTIVKLKLFDKRRVPTMEQFERQIAQRFGIKSDKWKIILFDSTKTPSDPNYLREVGDFNIVTMDNTRIRFERLTDEESSEDPSSYRVIGPEGEPIAGLSAGFKDEDGMFYGLTGWIAYAKEPYKDELMAGIRIYCRGKIAAQTSVFGQRAGFTGEHDVRSYLVGELHANWLDETEDLILTDRRDILWSHEVGLKFQEWGQKVVKQIGKLTRQPLRKQVWEEFQEIGKVEERIQTTFPREEHEDIKDNAWEIIERMGGRMRREELTDTESVESMVELGLMLAPHVTLNRKLREAADETTKPLAYVTNLLKTARLAELSSYGQIAEDRVNVIEKLMRLQDDLKAEEAHFQRLITEAPWLIDAQWSPLAANQPFSTLKRALEKYFQKRTHKVIILNDFSDPLKRPDFVLSSEGRSLQLVEIKKPEHALKNKEMDRIINYVQIMRDFLNDPSHGKFLEFFNKFHVTLVCEEHKLSGAQLEAFNGLQERGELTWLSWQDFLLRTRRAHEVFLKEAERQRQYGTEER